MSSTAETNGRTPAAALDKFRWSAVEIEPVNGKLPVSEIIAHRGASGDAPENTRSSVRLAWEQGADAVEVDVHVTRDGQIVVIHDETLQRTTGDARAVRDTDWADLQPLDCGSWKNAKWAGERLALLDDVLALVPADKRIYVEIKAPQRAAMAGFESLMARQRGRLPQMSIIGFSLPLVRTFKQRFPEVPSYWVIEFLRATPESPWDPDPFRCIEIAKELGLDGIDVSACEAVDRRFVDAVHAAGLRCVVWTVDRVDVARRLIDAGVDGITTNWPGRLRGELG